MKRLLNRHVKNFHNCPKVHKCERCSKIFTRSGALKEHIKAVHEKIKDKVCEECGMGFSDAGNLSRHKKGWIEFMPKKFRFILEIFKINL